jgi:hypothetical protein
MVTIPLTHPPRINCCCNYGSSVSGEYPEFECYACPKHSQFMAGPDELCKRHSKERNRDGKIETEDGRTIVYKQEWTEADEAQAKGRIVRVPAETYELPYSSFEEGVKYYESMFPGRQPARELSIQISANRSGERNMHWQVDFHRDAS